MQVGHKNLGVDQMRDHLVHLQSASELSRSGSSPNSRPSSSNQKGAADFGKWITRSVARGSTPDVKFIKDEMVLEQLLSALPSSTEKVCHCYS